MSTVNIQHPAWCDPSECDADTGTGRGCHQAKPITVPYDRQSRSSACVLMVQSSGENETWICIELHTVDLQGGHAEYSQLLTTDQARLLGRHLLRAGQEAIAAAEAALSSR